MKTKMEKFSILSLSWMLISTYSVSTALPAMKEYYTGYSGSQVEFLVSVAALGITCTILFNALIAKYLKERLMVAGGLLLLSVSGVLPVFTDVYPVILVSRFLLGIGIGLVNVKAISIISERYSGRGQETLLGFRSSFEMLGNAVLTLVVGQLLVFGWQKAFSVYALGFLVLALYLMFVPVNSVKTVHTAAENSTPGTFDQKNMWTAVFYTICGFLLVVANAACSLRIPVLVEERGFGTASTASIVLSILMSMGILAGFLYGNLLKICRERLFFFCFAGYCVGMLLMAAAGNFFLFMAGAVITGFAHTTGVTCVFNGVAADEPGELLSIVNSTVLVGCNLGSACAPFLIGGMELVWPVSFAAFPVIGIVLLLIGWLKGRRLSVGTKDKK